MGIFRRAINFATSLVTFGRSKVSPTKTYDSVRAPKDRWGAYTPPAYDVRRERAQAGRRANVWRIRREKHRGRLHRRRLANKSVTYLVKGNNPLTNSYSVLPFAKVA